MVRPPEASDGSSDPIGPRSAPEIFCNALELPVGERTAYLDRECAGDGALRADVESLLRAQAGGANFLKRSLQITSPGEILTELLGGAAAGARVGPYRIVHLLGAGGMGAVYLAERVDETFQKRVAIKLIRPGFWESDVVQRFRTERQVLADLEHPGIARLIDGGSTAEDLPYFVMEYVDGTPITEYCEDQRLDLASRLGLFIEVCNAVQYAHQNLVIHRDLKPSNILVDRSGRVKLLDFGIAKVLGGRGRAAKEDLTATARHPLTPRYASPEQVLGRRLSTATDIYSLGVVLYEMLTGGFPYELESKSPAEVIHAIASDTPIRPSRRVAHHDSRRLAGDLDGILLKALHKDPARRYVTAEEFAADLRHHLTGLPVLARPDTATYRVSKFVTRNKALVGGTIGVILVLAAALIVMLDLHRKATSRGREAEWQAYVASLAAAESALRGDQVAEAATYLERAPQHLRSWEWHHLRFRLDRSLESFQAHPTGITRIVYFPDGKRFLTTSTDSTLKVWGGASGGLDRKYGPFTSEVETAAPVPGTDLIAAGLNDGTVLLIDRITGTTRELHQPGARWAFLSVRPDGARLACGFFDGNILVWSMPEGSLVKEWKAHISLALPVYSPDGKLIATAGGDGSVTLYDGRSIVKIRDLGGHERRVYSMAFSPDGSRLATGSIDRTVNIWSVHTGELVRTFREHRATIAAIAFDPKGDRVATAASDNRLLLWSLSTGEVLGVFRGHIPDVYALAANPDGSGLVSGDWDGVVKSWEWDTQDVRTLRVSAKWIVAQIFEAAWDPAESTLVCGSNCGFLPSWKRSGRQLSAFDTGATNRSVVYSRDGSILLTGDDQGQIVMFRVDGSAPRREIPAHRGTVTAVALSPDGGLLATAATDSTMKLWTYPEIDPVRSLAGHVGAVEDVEFSPDGGLIASCGEDGTIRLCDPESGESRGILQSGSSAVHDIAFDGGGRRLLSASRDGTMRIWDVATRRLVRAIEIPGTKLFAVAWSRDGSRIVAGGSDATVRIYDATSGRDVLNLHGHVSGITSLQFGHDDAILTSTAMDGMVKLWETAHRLTTAR